jgi:hypothetical protein
MYDTAPQTNSKISQPMRPRHPRWTEFIDRLAGPAACNFKAETWTCFGDTRFTERILASMGLEPAAVAASVRHFRSRGGYCDCEVVFNVDRRWREAGG